MKEAWNGSANLRDSSGEGSSITPSLRNLSTSAGKRLKALSPLSYSFGRGAVIAVAGLLAVPASIALANPPRPDWHPGDPFSPVTQPQSSEVLEISHLFWVLLTLGGIVFFIVLAGVIISIVRFSAKKGDDSEPPQVFGNRRLELTWTLIPTVILAISFIVTVKAMNDINAPKTNKAVFDVNVVGHQWWWEFQYPSLGIVTADEVHVPAGQYVRFHITSYDVIHSFWTPQLQRQIDANPGLENVVYLNAENPGEFAGACYEYCGTEHAFMKFKEIVQTPVQFRAWVKHEQQPANQPTNALQALGKKVFDATTCVNCHAIQNPLGQFSPGGAVGPNLTHLASRWAFAGGAAPMTENDLMNWVYDPNTYKPGVVMPGYSFLSKKDLHALAAYLISLK